MQLANIRTDEEYTQFDKEVTTNGLSWMGGQMYFNNWLWISNGEQVNFKYFDYDQPDDQTFERCLGIETHKKLHDYDCNQAHSYICEEL